MKALKSTLASKLLADPQAREELRRFIVASRAGSATARAVDAHAHIRLGSSGETVKAEFVPKAKAA